MRDGSYPTAKGAGNKMKERNKRFRAGSGRRILAGAICAICAICLAAGTGAAAAEETYTLPTDLSVGMPLDESRYLDSDTYEDPTIRMHITTGHDFETLWWMAEVKIGHASQLRTMPAYKFDSTANQVGRNLSRRANAVLACNGDYFCMDVAKKGSYVLRQGVLYSEHLTGKSDILLIDEEGDFHFVHKAVEGDIPESIDGKALVNGLCFGPALVENGKVNEIEPDDFMITEKKVARMALCQMGPLEYAVICCSGPAVGSLGMTLQDFATLAGKNGAIHAYNLDGGNSAMMFTGSRMININRTTRQISDIVYFASAWPEGAGK